MSLAARVRPVPLLWLSGLAARGLAFQPWWTWAVECGAGDAAGGPSLPVTGAAATDGLASILALVALAGAVLTLALRPPGRRVLGVLLAAVHAAILSLGLLDPTPGVDALPDPYRQVGVPAACLPVSLGTHWLFAAVGAVGIAASAWMAWRPGTGRAGGVQAKAAVEDSLAAWKTMDEGLDPTDDAERKERP